MAGRPGRRERPLDPEAGPLERFALGLRALRESAELTYAEMASASHFSSSALSQAAAGHRLPTRDVVLAYVSACGGEPRDWERRWERLRLAVHAEGAPPAAVGALPYSFGETEATSFVGREAELAAAEELLDRYRVVTLTGVGGVGKTRLAGRVVRNVRERFAGGVHGVELADLMDQHAITEAIASAVGVQVASGQDGIAALAEALRGREVLLLLDNCEHVLTGCARTVSDLLARLPQLRVLATSRQPLGMGAEYVLQVNPLDLRVSMAGHPDGASTEDQEWAASPAMVLFSHRAEAASPGFRITDENRHLVARVCQKLDGLPLALEIAARRLRTLTPDELLERLNHRFRLLGPGGSERTAHPRHQALRALFDWSYEWCTEDERRAWQQLSLCTGGVLLTDAERLCGPVDQDSSGANAEDGAFEALAGLVDKSLLTRVVTGTRTRLHMLETVRAYGQERLADSGRAQHAWRRHRAWYLHLAAQAGAAYGSSEEAGWLRRLRVEHANLRQIVTAPPLAGEAPDTVLHASLGFWLHCLTSANVGEGAGWMREIFERHPHPPSPEATIAWCRAAWVSSFLLLLHGDHRGAQDMISRGERVLADTAFEGSAGSAREGTDRNKISAAFLQMRSLVALVAGDMEATAKHAHSALAAGHFSDSLLTEAQCVAQLGFAAVIQGDRDRSTRLLEQALEMSETRGDTWHRCYLLWALAVDHGEARRSEIALRYLRRALRHMREIDENMGEAALGETLAWVLSLRGDSRPAAVLLGAVDRAWHPAGAPRLFGFALLAAHREHCIGRAREALGATEFMRAHQEGRRVGLREALERAFLEKGPGREC
ncbi:helix-turn-helix domain-containing protein [Streptomyces sp. NPDC016469]|uniref:ATP-binding protein n=1 Tax=Streptomyces sp. NPDC016469 TaxID=3157191 RepID=UPI0034025574